jgi:hypothetical protein
VSLTFGEERPTFGGRFPSERSARSDPFGTRDGALKTPERVSTLPAQQGLLRPERRTKVSQPLRLQSKTFGEELARSAIPSVAPLRGF